MEIKKDVSQENNKMKNEIGFLPYFWRPVNYTRNISLSFRYMKKTSLKSRVAISSIRCIIQNLQISLELKEMWQNFLNQWSLCKLLGFKY